MSTPESNKIPASAGHSNGAIRKSLLTPYRRIGLSRNRQPSKSNSFVSPLQNKEPILIDNVSLSPVNQNTSLLDKKVCTTPVVHKNKKSDGDTKQNKQKLSEDNVCQSSDLIRTHSPEIKRKGQRKISDKYQQEKRCNKESSEDTRNQRVPEKESFNHIIVSNDSKYSINKTVSTNLIKNVIDNDLDERISKKAKVCDYKEPDYSYINNDHDYVNKSKENSVKSIEEQTTDDLRRNSMDNNLNVKVILHRVDGKCSKKIEEVDDFQESYVGLRKDICTKPTVSIDNHETCLKENNLITNNETTIDIKQKQKSSKSIKRKFSLKKSTSSSNLSENGEVSDTTNQQDNTNMNAHQERPKIIDDIIKLEATVENKEDELRRLQQAQVYRNIHKVEDLQAETYIWKSGCQEALGDLLIKLNEHNSIDMNGLLSKLKVPSHLISYDSETDCFL